MEQQPFLLRSLTSAAELSSSHTRILEEVDTMGCLGPSKPPPFAGRGCFCKLTEKLGLLTTCMLLINREEMIFFEPRSTYRNVISRNTGSLSRGDNVNEHLEKDKGSDELADAGGRAGLARALPLPPHPRFVLLAPLSLTRTWAQGLRLSKAASRRAGARMPSAVGHGPGLLSSGKICFS